MSLNSLLTTAFPSKNGAVCKTFGKAELAPTHIIRHFQIIFKLQY